MGILLDILTAPVLGPIRGALWIARTVAEHAEREMYDEDGVRRQLAELELRHDLGEIGERELEEEEEALLERLGEIRKAKEGR